jgi:predicted transcriptional regulator
MGRRFRAVPLSCNQKIGRVAAPFRRRPRGCPGEYLREQPLLGNVLPNRRPAMADDASETLLTLTADIVAAHVANNSVASDQLGPLIGNVHAALAGLVAPAAAEEAEQAPAVSIRASVKQEHIICLEDGKKMKMLKRHLMTDHNMTPAEYRAKWKLPADYPYVDGPRLARTSWCLN